MVHRELVTVGNGLASKVFAMQTRESGSESRNPYKSQAWQHTSAITMLWELETAGSLRLQARQPLRETQFK